MAKSTVAFTVDMPGIKPLLRTLSRMPKDIQNGVRDAAQKIAEDEAARIVAAANLEGRRARLAAKSVRARRDRVPVIVAGGSKSLQSSGSHVPRPRLNPKTGKLVRRKKPKPHKVAAGDLFFGAEFGGDRRPTTAQFDRHLGTEGYWFWPTLRKDSDKMTETYMAVLDQVVKDWDRDQEANLEAGLAAVSSSYLGAVE